MIKQSKLWLTKEAGGETPGGKDIKQVQATLAEDIIRSRGLDHSDDFSLHPSWEILHDPFRMQDMQVAIDRIRLAVERDEKVLIYGDYDADGITATALLVSALKSICANVSWYIPDRMKEGYGLHVEALEEIASNGIKLVISVDCGISGHRQAALCQSLGVDLIITDHHEPSDRIPEALAVINPKRDDCSYPFKGLSGVGVAFKLMQALFNNEREKLIEYLDLVAVGTIADIVPLLSENRYLVQQGLALVQKGSRPGLQALINVSGASGREVNAETVGYVIGPRINASGRVGYPSTSVELLLDGDLERVRNMASILDQWNRERQHIESGILEQVKSVISANNYENDYVIVVDGHGWHPGVVGIVSSRITDYYGKPSIILTKEPGNKMAKGSGRSIEGFNLFKALNYCKDWLEVYGGHEQAAGLTIRVDNIDEFRKTINILARKVLAEEDLLPSLMVDVELKPEWISLEIAAKLKELMPFGEGNSNPLFLSRDMLVAEARTVGNGDHLKLKFACGGNTIDGIAFSFGGLAAKIDEGARLDVVYHIDINIWNGRQSVQMIVRDIKDSILMDNLTAGKTDFMNIDSFSLHHPDIAVTAPQSSTRAQLAKYTALELWCKQNGATSTATWSLIRRALKSGEQSCILVNTREQAKHIRFLLTGETGGDIEPVTIHERMKIADQKVNWDKFINEQSNPLIFTGIEPFLHEEAGSLKNLFCLYPFYSKEHYELVKEWMQMHPATTIYYFFSEKQLQKNMMLLKNLFPDSDMLRKIYICLRNLFVDSSEIALDLIEWSEQIRLGQSLLPETLWNSLLVYQELGLVNLVSFGTKVQLKWLGEPKNKLELNASQFFSASQQIKRGYQRTFSNFKVGN